MKITELTESQNVSDSEVMITDGSTAGTRKVTFKNVISSLIKSIYSRRTTKSSIQTSDQFPLFESDGSLKFTTMSTIYNSVANSMPESNELDLLWNLIDRLPFSTRKTIYRGNSLGTTITDAQKTAIKNGTFEGLYIGDYWTRNGKKYVIVDMDYWYNTGSTAFTDHHLVVMPEVPLYSAAMNATNTTDGGYAGSALHNTGLSNARTTITAAFSGMVLPHYEYISNAVTSGVPSGEEWQSVTVEVPDEIMLCGFRNYGPATYNNGIPSIITTSKGQFALYRLRPDLLTYRASSQWLRSPLSATRWATIDGSGQLNHSYASNALGVRPVFAVGVQS